MTDHELIGEYVKDGTATALETLVGRHIGRIRGMIHTLVLNDADADDLTQEVFLRAVSRLDRFRGNAEFSTWLYRIAMNTTKSFIRRKGRDRLELRLTVPEETDPRPRPEARLMAKEDGQVLRDALARLPVPLRSAFALVVIQGLTPREAARAERCFLSTIYRRVDAARKALSNALRGVA